MKNLRVSNRYAKALLALAQENNYSEGALKDMELIYNTFEISKDLNTVLNSPIVRVAKKINIIAALFEEKINPFTLTYLKVITRKKRASLIKGIAFEFIRLHREDRDIETVILITAGEIDAALSQKAKTIALSISKKSNIEFKQVSDPSIIGGFILRIGDVQYDASVRKKLSSMKKHLLEH